MGERDGDGSGAGADVKDIERCGAIEFFEDGFDEVLGLGAGDENGWSDAEGEAVEFLLAGDVLDWLVFEAASDEGVVGGLLGGREGAVGIGEEGGAGDVERVQEQEERVAGRFGAKVG